MPLLVREQMPKADRQLGKWLEMGRVLFRSQNQDFAGAGAGGQHLHLVVRRGDHTGADAVAGQGADAEGRSAAWKVAGDGTCALPISESGFRGGGRGRPASSPGSPAR